MKRCFLGVLIAAAAISMAIVACGDTASGGGNNPTGELGSKPYVPGVTLPPGTGGIQVGFLLGSGTDGGRPTGTITLRLSTGIAGLTRDDIMGLERANVTWGAFTPSNNNTVWTLTIDDMDNTGFYNLWISKTGYSSETLPVWLYAPKPDKKINIVEVSRPETAEGGSASRSTSSLNVQVGEPLPVGTVVSVIFSASPGSGASATMFTGEVNNTFASNGTLTLQILTGQELDYNGEREFELFITNRDPVIASPASILPALPTLKVYNALQLQSATQMGGVASGQSSVFNPAASSTSLTLTFDRPLVEGRVATAGSAIGEGTYTGTLPTFGSVTTAAPRSRTVDVPIYGLASGGTLEISASVAGYDMYYRNTGSSGTLSGTIFDGNN